jgi:hypothetical protein
MFFSARRIRRHSRGGRRRRIAMLPLLVIAALALSPAPRHRLSDAVSAPVPLACSGLPADDEYLTDAAELGEEHACEHQRARTSGRNEDPDEPTSINATPVATTGADPASVGQWSPPFLPGTKTIGITSVVLNTGKLLLWGGPPPPGTRQTPAYLFDPVTRTGRDVYAPGRIFCGGQTLLGDGSVFSVGGTSGNPHGIPDIYRFDVATAQWVRQPDTPLGRYYPTTTRLADGRVLITAGTESDGVTRNPVVELYTPPAPGQSVGTLRAVGPPHPTSYYPHQWVMPDGKVLQASTTSTSAFDPAAQSWAPLPALRVATGDGSAGLLLAGPPSGSTRVLVVGGNLGKANTQTFNYATPAAGWAPGGQLPNPRIHMNVVQVPDGSAFGFGGNSSGLYDIGQRRTLFYDPATGGWTGMAVQTPRRAYHSTAVLLPDGRIMSAGDDGDGGGRQVIDFYSPPYLFKGPRPVITGSPAAVSYGSTFSITVSGPAWDRAVLVAPGATTHAVDTNSRVVRLTGTVTASGMTLKAPSANLAPRGYYMLFALTPGGVPSVARWVHVGP